MHPDYLGDGEKDPRFEMDVPPTKPSKFHEGDSVVSLNDIYGLVMDKKFDGHDSEWMYEVYFPNGPSNNPVWVYEQGLKLGMQVKDLFSSEDEKPEELPTE